MAKTNYSEINYLAIPPVIAGVLRQTGLSFASYYDNVSSHPKDFRGMRTFPFYCLLQFLDGDCIFIDENHPTPVKLSPGQGLIVTPGAKQEYGAKKNYFVEDSVCFSGPTADALMQAGIIRQGVMEIGRERVLLPIINKIREGTLLAHLDANLMLQQLLLDLYRSNSTSRFSEPQRQLERLLVQINKTAEEWWTVKNMAGYCNISENYLRRLFREQTGMSPKEYIEQLKMRQAAELLVGTSLKVHEIAARLGYVDPYHFIHRFTVKTGVPPGRYRVAHAQQRS